MTQSSANIVACDSSYQHVLQGDRFRAQSVFSVAANSVYWYKVTIPADRVIATLGRLWISDLGGVTLEVFGLPVGGVAGTPWTNRNNNGRSAATTFVVIAPYTTAPTSYSADPADTDYVPTGAGGAKSTGGYQLTGAFRIYAPGDYAVRITNPNNSACKTIIEYDWLDVLNIMSLR